jgi:hypothetical protein
MIYLGATQTSFASDTETWTEVGLYGFATAITGDATIRNVETELDVTPQDILDNLEIGGMGFIEHRRNKWSFIGDIAYMNLSSDKTTSVSSGLSVTLDAEVQQLITEGFVGYRFHEIKQSTSSTGFDILAGARFTHLSLKIGAQASALGLVTSASRDRTENWVDGVIGIRAQYKNDNGWGASGWIDVGGGDNSYSAQAIGLVSHTFENDIKLFGGYRYLSLNRQSGSGTTNFELNARYHGPLIGLSYKF